MADRIENWHRLAQLVSSVEASLAKALQSNHGIGLTEFRALGHLCDAENAELRMQDLAGRLQLNQSSVTRVVERLERLGLTVRDTCPQDKRGVYTVLTESGREKLKSAMPDYERHILQVLNDRDTRNMMAGMITFPPVGPRSHPQEHAAGSPDGRTTW